jgi:hypothetical protein
MLRPIWTDKEMLRPPSFHSGDRMLDIFKMEQDGNLLWRGISESLEAAKLSVKALAGSSPGDYLIFSQETGEKTVIIFDGSIE